MDDKERILAFIRARGPSLPTTIAKQIEGNSLFISAHLSEMKEQGKIRISNVKVGGGSPLYYLPGQESQLQNFSDNLGEKEKKVYDLLKDKKVLRDSALVPVFRAAIRTIKDYAFPIKVNFKGNNEVFWRWFLLKKEEAEKLIKGQLGIKEKKPIVKSQEKKEEKKVEEKPKSAVKKEEKVETQKKEESKQETKKEEQKRIIEPKGEKKPSGDFYQEIINYFSGNNIKVIEEKLIRKTEIDFVVEVPSPVGELKYFVKAKSKKKLNDGDLSSVFIQGQMKKLPVLFLGKGDLTKKAAEMLETEFKSMRYNRLD